MSRSIGGETEAAIMDVVWSAAQPLTVREIMEGVNTSRRRGKLAYTTVLTVVNNLADKDMLLRDANTRAFRYEAAVTREDYTASRMTQALAETPDRTAALLQFTAQLTDAERAVLLEHARRLRRRR